MLHVRIYLLPKLNPRKETLVTPDPEMRSAIWLHTSDECGEHFYFEGSRLKVTLNSCHVIISPPPKNYDTITYKLFPVLSLTKM